MAMVGQIYYRFWDGELDKFRITKFIKSSQRYECKYEGCELVAKLTDEQIKEAGYILLKPNGYITISSVILEQNLHDIIVGFHRTKDIENGDNTPYACCRQSVIDIFANMTNRQADEFEYVGIAIDKDICPEDVDYRMMLACNSVDKSEIVAYYIGDDIKKLLSWTKLSYYNGVLEYMYNIANRTKFKGYHKTVLELVETNEFIYNVYRAFDIKPVGIEFMMADTEDDLYAANPLIPLVENIVKTRVNSAHIIKYGYDIDLSQIKRSYILIADSAGRIYVLVYDEGEYYNPGYAQIDDKRELKVLEAILAAKSKS